MNNDTANSPITAPTTLGELQHAVHDWITTVGGGYFSPLTNAVILAEETGEVARVMARKYGDQRAKPGDKETEAVRKNIEKKNRRDGLRFKDKEQDI